MRVTFFAFALLGALVAVAPVNADCTTSLATLVAGNPWLLTHSNDAVAKQCADNGTSFKAALRTAANNCGVSSQAASVFLNLIGDLICAKEGDKYCVVAMLAMFPLGEIIGEATQPNFDIAAFLAKTNFYQKLNVASDLDKICLTGRCTSKIVGTVVKLMTAHDYKTEAAWLVGMSRASNFACQKDESNGYCALKQYVSAGVLNTTAICRADGKVATCFRKLLSSEHAFITNGIGVLKGVVLDTVCPKVEKKDKAGSFTLNLPTLLWSYVSAHMDTIIDFVKRDLIFNIAGLGLDDLTVSVKQVGNATQVTVNVTLGDLFRMEDNNLMNYVTSFKTLLAGHGVTTFPNLDSLASTAFSGSELVSAAATIGVVTVNATAIIQADQPDGKANSASAASLGFGVATTIVLGLAF